MKFEIDEKLLQIVLNFLVTNKYESVRPIDVMNLVDALRNLKKIEGEKDVSNPNN